MCTIVMQFYFCSKIPLDMYGEVGPVIYMCILIIMNLCQVIIHIQTAHLRQISIPCLQVLWPFTRQIWVYRSIHIKMWIIVFFFFSKKSQPRRILKDLKKKERTTTPVIFLISYDDITTYSKSLFRIVTNCIKHEFK